MIYNTIYVTLNCDKSFLYLFVSLNVTDSFLCSSKRYFSALSLILTITYNVHTGGSAELSSSSWLHLCGGASSEPHILNTPSCKCQRVRTLVGGAGVLLCIQASAYPTGFIGSSNFWWLPSPPGGERPYLPALRP